MEQEPQKGVAIIGMAGRFPGAKNVDQFWDNLCKGVESISFFSDEEVAETGVDPLLLKHPDYVKAWGILDDVELFDANYFGIPGREAEAMDPQHRLFLECCTTALEHSGYNPDTYEGNIGLVCGVGLSTYLLRNLAPNAEHLQALGEYLTFTGNDKDFMGTRVSYKLNLRGPSHSVSTACSTSMVAIHAACRQLLSYESDIALAGASNIKLPQKSGYLYRKGHLKSPDGHCHAFDAKARGTVFGNGVATVVLKRAQEAIEDGDYIYGFIRATALNNDGASKAGYTAPSVSGQAEVIALAHELAGFPPETITHMEAHGTGTELGDPIEIKAVSKTMGNTDKKQFCALTSVKTNVGHLDCAGGVTGMIKVALSLRHKLIPPSLNFETPNPEIDFENSPFYVNTKLQDWQPEGGMSRRACISAFGAGGTNAHAVLEEAPELAPSDEGRTHQLLTFSAKSPNALQSMTENLLDHVKAHPELKLADVVFTMNVGRRLFNHRRAMICTSRDDLIELLSQPEHDRVMTRQCAGEDEALDRQMADLVADLQKSSGNELALLNKLADLWLQGGKMDWLDFYEGEYRHRLPLPTYPFEHKRYWIDQPAGLAAASEEIAGKKAAEANLFAKKPLDQWFYEPSWQKRGSRGSVDVAAGSRWLVFCDPMGVGEQLANDLVAAGGEVFSVRIGDEFEKPDEHHYVIDPMNPNHYNGILTELQNLGKSPDGLVHCWNISEYDDPEAAVNGGFYSLLYLSQAAIAQSYQKEVRLMTVSTHLHNVLGDDKIHPHKAMALALVRVLPQEHNHLACLAVDVEMGQAAKPETVAGQLLTELTGPLKDNVVAYRANRRWIPTFDHLELASVADHPKLRENGTYLITGGLGGIGLVLADHLAEAYKANLVLIGRSNVPNRDQWASWLAQHGEDDATSRRIRKVEKLEAHGGRVLALAADVADKAAMQAVCQQANDAFGEVHGVIHAAGVADVGMIERLSHGAAQSMLAAKVDGTLVLADLFADQNLDFLALCSSNAALIGGYGQVAYVAANTFQDAFAQQHADKGIIAMNWDGWNQVGMAVNRQTEDLQKKGISNQEGIEAFRRALAAGLPQVAIATHNLPARVEAGRHFKVDDKERALVEGKRLTYPRPEMSVPYLAPRNPLEQSLADIWQHLLGMDKVGVEDDFFELGGDSLQGMNLVNKLEQTLRETITLDAMFDSPTIAGLAGYLEEEFPAKIASLVGRSSFEEEAEEEGVVLPIDAEILGQAKRWLPAPAASAQGPKNKPAVFILAPPRSGSTLLRVMMAGNPGLFAPPELNLLNFESMKEREERLSPQQLEGLLIGLMLVKDCAVPHAQSIVEDFIRDGASTQAFYGYLQSLLPGQRLVDKTPLYSLNRQVLQRAEETFENARFIHLQRHPLATIFSFEDARTDKALAPLLQTAHPVATRTLAELSWLTAHDNIRDFLSDIPADRQMALRFEDLVSQPREEMERLCKFLDLDFDEGMLTPYLEKNIRMTEGLNTGGHITDDDKFLNYSGIDPSVADAWRSRHEDDFLSDLTRQMADDLGYEIEASMSDEMGADDMLDVDNMDASEVEALYQQMMDENE